MGITLIGKDVAVVGNEFYYLGALESCEGCRLKSVCFNLEEGTRYRVTNVRGQEHDCPELDDERIVAVEVEKVPSPAILPKKGLLEGITVTYAESKCDNVGCKYWHLCHPVGKLEGKKYSVVRMGEDVPCPRDERLSFVDLL
ncbi:UPF0179 family protein [Candidatus Methanoprimaticola sp. MG2]|uniref:UPF0179 family protein n=1 Tax=Candidatus Methanoprimaticola sp. MG2 TaxID=3228838 RepID=UPI0039C6B2BE